MRAIFKNDKRLLVNTINREDRIVLEAFVEKFKKYEVDLVALNNIDSSLDGVKFIISDRVRNKIVYDIPFLQVLIQDTETTVDLGTDEQTTIELINDYRDEIRASLEGSVLSIYAYEIPELVGKTRQYVLYAKLNKEECQQTTVPINIVVIYRKDFVDYEELENLPKMNGTTIIGDKELDEFGIQEEMETISNTTIQDIIDRTF